MGRVRVVDTSDVYANAIKQRKVFYGSAAKRKVHLSAPWPTQLIHIGKCAALVYYSNKSLNGGKWEIYKHIAEAGQDLFINPETTTLFGRNGCEVRFRVGVKPNLSLDEESEKISYVHGCDIYEIDSAMPRYITTLAEDRGLQAVLHDGSYYEIRIPHAYWGSGVHPGNNETFLVLYSGEGIHFLVTGDELDITEDGVTG